MAFQIHNLTAVTDTWCGNYTTYQAAKEALLRWKSAWPSNQYSIRNIC
jgi:hypothetical protein